MFALSQERYILFGPLGFSQFGQHTQDRKVTEYVFAKDIGSWPPQFTWNESGIANVENSYTSGLNACVVMWGESCIGADKGEYLALAFNDRTECLGVLVSAEIRYKKWHSFGKYQTDHSSLLLAYWFVLIFLHEAYHKQSGKLTPI